jgi:2-polyprenyl-3-methyl-5-hydroxy-6-metoxy-1,4-benzoquinol methylase
MALLRVFANRLIQPELLDHALPDEARLNLADLVRINRNLGGHSTIRGMLAQVVPPDDKFTLLDIGAASGDTARLILQLYPRAYVTSLDYSPVNLEAAPPSKLIADAFELPFLPGSFDYVLCSLFLHHFSDEQVVGLLQSFYHAAKRALLVCDLERHIVSYYFLPLTKWLFGWQRITLHDGPVSVRAAFRSDELLTLANRAGIRDARVSVHRPAFRLSLIAKKTGLLTAPLAADDEDRWALGGRCPPEAPRSFRVHAPNR